MEKVIYVKLDEVREILVNELIEVNEELDKPDNNYEFLLGRRTELAILLCKLHKEN